MADISGGTKLLPIIGRPIQQVKAPMVFNRFFEANDIDAVTFAVELTDDAADAFIQAMRGCTNTTGYIATIPHKQRSAAACDVLSDRGRFLGAVNLIRREPDGRLVGDMTDGVGCVTAMRSHGVDPKGKAAVVVGVGGAGSAIAHALADAGVLSLALLDMDQTRADKLAARLAAVFPNTGFTTTAPDMTTIDIAANASPVGMHDDPNLPISLDGIRPGSLVTDVVTMPEQTPWLRAAAAAGCITQTGIEMVQGQFEMMATHFGFRVD
ncbi:MAG: shikimate dehydrogenase family protein [Alphaproteobacteria bacterium]